MSRASRIAAERLAMQLAPWQFAPSQVTDGPSVWPSGVGHLSWIAAQQQRAAILARNPHYFDDDETEAESFPDIRPGSEHR